MLPERRMLDAYEPLFSDHNIPQVLQTIIVFYALYPRVFLLSRNIINMPKSKSVHAQEKRRTEEAQKRATSASRLRSKNQVKRCKCTQV